jgi:hypothetical protein
VCVLTPALLGVVLLLPLLQGLLTFSNSICDDYIRLKALSFVVNLD